MTIVGGLTWRVRLVTFVHVPFSPPPLLILAFQPILFHTAIVTEGHYMLFSIEEQSCLTVVCQMTCQRSHICWCASCWHNVFVQFFFGSFCLASSETGVAFLQEDYWTHQFAWAFLFSWDRCLRLSFSLLTLFVIWHSGTDMIQIYRCSRKKSVDYLVCSICLYGIDQALFHQLKVVG